MTDETNLPDHDPLTAELNVEQAETVRSWAACGRA